MRRAKLSKILLLCILAAAAPIPAAAAENAATTSVSETTTDSVEGSASEHTESDSLSLISSAESTTDSQSPETGSTITSPTQEPAVSDNDTSGSENENASEGISGSENNSVSENDTSSESVSVSEDSSVPENDASSESVSVSEDSSVPENDTSSESVSVSEDSSVPETIEDSVLLSTEQASCAETAKESESGDPSEKAESTVQNKDTSTKEAPSNTGPTAEEKTADRIHFIALNGNYYSSDAILVESNGLYGLIDASHPSGLYKDTYNFADTSANGQTVVKYLTDINVSHLKFVLATHSHSDHIGGMPDIAASGVVDSDTVYIYKDYELDETAQVSYHNGYYAELAIEAMKETGATLLNLLNPDSEVMNKLGATLVKDKEDTVGDHLLFSMGDFLIKLFNLHNESDTNENLNSVVTTVQKDETRAVLMADIEMDDYMESRTVNAILRDDDTTETAVYKLGHHGYNSSTSLDTIKALNSQNYVVSTNSVDQNPAAGTIFNYFIEESGRKIYRTSENGSAIIADFGNHDVTMLKTSKKRGETSANPWYATIADGWHVWYPDEDSYNVTGFKWIYIKSGAAVSGWFKSESNWYYADKDYIMQTGWLDIGKNRYYLNAGGAMQTGWQKISNKWYYMNTSGVVQTGWQKIGNKWYYMNAEGTMQTGWQKISNKWYYMSASGALQTGWQKISNKWYYMGASGALQTGWQKISNKWYYMSASGALQTGWQKIGDKWYYMDAGGVMQTGWQKIGNKWYYFEANGTMVSGKWVGGYYLKTNGQMAVNEWIGSYYVGADGKQVNV